MGDLNEDYKFDKMHNSRLHQMEVLYGMKQLIKSHTRVTLTTSTLIDVMLTSNYESHILSDVHDTAMSYHYMIYTAYSEMCKHKANNVHNEINFRNYKKFDIYDFRKAILRNTNITNIHWPADEFAEKWILNMRLSQSVMNVHQ